MSQLQKCGTPPESGGVARRAGVVPKPQPCRIPLRNHPPSRDVGSRFAIPLPS
jgi:hypothetical protein